MSVWFKQYKWFEVLVLIDIVSYEMIQHKSKYKHITSSLSLDFCKIRGDWPVEHLNQEEKVVERKVPGPQHPVKTDGVAREQWLGPTLDTCHGVTGIPFA